MAWCIKEPRSRRHVPRETRKQRRQIPCDWRNPGAAEALLHDDDPTQRVSVHPRSRFATLNVTTDDVEVEEIGFYSVCEDPESGKSVVESNRAGLRPLTIHCDPASPIEVAFRLDEGFDKFERMYIDPWNAQ